jgi:hypothetical protein
VKSCAHYIALAKKLLGDPRMSDRELGERLGALAGVGCYAQQTIAGCKVGAMSDPLAITIAKVIGVAPGEVIMAARLEREKDPFVRDALTEWVWRKRSVSRTRAPRVALSARDWNVAPL